MLRLASDADVHGDIGHLVAWTFLDGVSDGEPRTVRCQHGVGRDHAHVGKAGIAQERDDLVRGVGVEDGGAGEEDPPQVFGGGEREREQAARGQQVVEATQDGDGIGPEVEDVDGQDPIEAARTELDFSKRVKLYQRLDEVDQEQPSIDYDHDWSNLPDDILLSEESRNILKVSIDALPETMRTVVIMKDIDGFSNEEIRILSALAELSAIAIEKARLYERLVDASERGDPAAVDEAIEGGARTRDLGGTLAASFPPQR